MGLDTRYFYNEGTGEETIETVFKCPECGIESFDYKAEDWQHDNILDQDIRKYTVTCQDCGEQWIFFEVK